LSESVFKRRIKIFTDSSEKTQMLETAKNPLISGLTTNPTLMKKAGVADYGAFAKDILSHIRDKPISFEVFADDLSTMERQAKEINTWAQNVYVKIPVTNSLGESTAKLVHRLSHAGVKLNVTAILTPRQVLEICSALQGGAPSVVSVFAGRIADTGRDPMPLMAASKEICSAHGKQIELLWASSRELLNVIQAEQVGCDIITVTAEIIKKMSGLDRDLDAVSLDTVKMFKSDAESAGYRL
jgi:transaldolase